MELLIFLKKLIKKENSNINELINISDSFVMPTRELFKDNHEMMSLIDSFKDEYKNILKDKQLLFSMDLTNSVNENIRMFSELITNIFTREEEKFSSLIKVFYKINKLNLYYQEIFNLHLECTARLVALLEIYNERKLFMPKHKKEALLYAMNILTNALVVFEAQKNAINMERENFLKQYEILSTQPEIIHDFVKKTFIEEKIKILNRVQALLNNPIEVMSLEDILYCEKECEMFVYKNKNNVEDVKQQIDYLYQFVEQGDYEEALSKFVAIFDLEKSALMYYYYGKDLIDASYINKLYEMKFIYILNRNDYKELLEEKRINVEQKSYVRSIEDRLNIITRGKNPTIRKLFKLDSYKAIKNIINLMCGDYGFDALVISTIECEYAKFLFSFDYEDGFIKFLESEKFKREDFVVRRGINFHPMEFCEDSFTWDEFIPLSAIFELARLKCIEDIPSNLNKIYYTLYCFYQDNLSYYKLPEGIKHIQGKVQPDWRTQNFIEGMNKCAKNKVVYLPDSLETLDGVLFYMGSIKELVLPDSLKYTSLHFLCCAKADSVTIPSSVEVIDNYGICDFEFAKVPLYNPYIDHVKTIIFKDYKNSIFLNSRNSIFNFLSYMCYIKEVNGEYILENVLEKIVLLDEKSNLVCEVDLTDISLKIFDFEEQDKAFVIKNSDVKMLLELTLEKVNICIESGKTLIKTK